MRFVQIIDFETQHIDEIRDLVQEAAEHSGGRGGGPTHRMVLQDRNTPDRYLVVIEFASHDDAVRNSEDPATTRMAERVAALCTRPPRFTDCDVRASDELK
ncbi:DUF1330 domain-containing protein [Streptomyces apricus]|uniref:Antibiotic biosynthesis monooxygenase n=1 Tax=Streptomyces apricus TaxID=1828112 RepID=A0A5B0AP22_9ACTN|nr:hypothetical protein [Streptomyces apricus]KAA0931650.1 hypothetical protein FGF04_22330 [Streptomyces apricus]